MDLNTFPSLDGRPLLAELFHHFLPDEERLVSELIYALLSLLLELVEAEASLDHCRLLHQELQVSVGDAGLMRSPVFLDDGGGENWTLLSLKHH